jgi:hypothetical protein
VSERSNFLKFVIVFAVGFSIGVGLCGLDYLLASKGIGKSTQEFGVGPLDGVSLIVMLLSALGLVITLVAWLFTAIISSLARETDDSEPTRLFDKENKDE